MDFNNFLSTLNTLKNNDLGGLESHFRLAPQMRLQYNEEKIKAKDPKKAAVLALFYPNNQGEACFLLTQRASYKGTHSAQISFPGGKIEEDDTNLEETALRETFEEVGVSKIYVTMIREMTAVYIPPSNFLATPFLGYATTKPNFIANNEVAELIEVKVDDLLDDKNISSVKMSTSYMENIDVPCFKLNNHIVWGATAMMLNEIKELFKQANV
ncbi:NUDIX domain-containing protein [Lutibacter sp. Hel_I_33_5]|uniref:NUDIX hydrolase n=1 Tax=Lutibacter sp. Hel_I_33_5 TaxID=1566289 RepID=UPI0011A35B41|nr:CoA pyrophosphatase [Lutibacter sp. Hel_I_33_5]TVZ54799.1 NUDIX domain-containing protein [Lutibacter sp. Hel_I_33_5]